MVDDTFDGLPRLITLDAKQLTTLAHPLRSRLLTALRQEGPATATPLAKRLGTNSGTTSYHLRKLAEVGLVTDAPDEGDGRDRWWQAASRGH
ncbi:MAG TPA: helix-turn-helix domain-containing protein, partial [Euzebya sp.]|nr:helix-turn-helix domain-containing protein [Euzebya sp.]